MRDFIIKIISLKKNFCFAVRLDNPVFNKNKNKNKITYNAKKTVVNTFGSKITGNVGSFILKSSPEILNLLSQTGIGSRRSQGFGCFEVIMEVK